MSAGCGHTKTNTNTREQDLALERKLSLSRSELNAVMGTKNTDFAEGLFTQVVNTVSRGPNTDINATNFALAAIAGIEPKDEIEAMLAAQMAAVHNATMRYAMLLTHSDTIRQQDSNSRALNQLARTFTAQVEALKRHRSSGQQVVVKHVTVNDGGQAVVGNVQTGGRGKQ